MAFEQEIKVPDIGGVSGVDVIELLVHVGDVIQKDTSLVVLESDKASMEIPSPVAGVVRAMKIKVGDKVSEGDLILTVEPAEGTETILKTEFKAEPVPVESKIEPEPTPIQAPVVEVVEKNTPSLLISAGPAVRRMAHELGVNLADIQGTGRKSRISKADLEGYVKQKLQEKTSALSLPSSSAPAIDFSKFGPIERKPLSKVKRLTGLHVHRSWVTIPHVTQFDEADITDLEAFRKAESAQAQAAGYKLTVLAFVCKVVSKALQKFPQFNASLDETGENLIYKQYYHVGIAVETPSGLVVPVIKDVDQASVSDIAKEMARLSQKARDKGLAPADMMGGCFTISSLGGLGGTAFTPIVNAPEVAILGLSRSAVKPVYDGEVFVPRLMLPLSLSYDHRVIDGAEAARFTRYLADGLYDIRRMML
ncbi:MAG: dihydrolipoyllysine-residue acetyltransferase [Legionellaceae bacterium]